MPNRDTPYQTIGEFLNSPFGSKDRSNTERFDQSYQKMVNAKTLYAENYTEVDGSYFIHVKVPSESKPGLWYDVVIQFFPANKEMEKTMNLGNYYIQFFSNSPSFIYQYAALYRLYGYLIDSLYEKTDMEHSLILPEKANPNFKMSYDKSIYLACKLLKDNQFTYLRKNGIKFLKYEKWDKFLRSIKEFELAEADAELYSLEKDVKKETEKQKAEASKAKKERLNPFSTKQKKIQAKHDTLGEGSPKSIKNIIKRKPVRSTSKNSSITIIKKKTPGSSTKKK